MSIDMHGGLHIALAAERLFELGGIPITNTLLAEWVVMAILLVTAVVVGRKPSLIPGKVQNFFELLFDFVLNYMEQILGDRKLAERFFPLVATIFIFIALSNLFDFIPFVGSLTYATPEGAVPLLRPVNSDLNVTLSLTFVAMFAIELSGILLVGFWRYAGKFINVRGKNFGQRALNFVVGLIELVSELSRFVSFSFRLFGNIFAGEVLLGVVGMFVPYVLPVPLMAFESFVGIVQAAVFAMLTLFFIKLAITESHHEAESLEAAH